MLSTSFVFPTLNIPLVATAHCPKNNLNLCIKIKPATAGAKARNISGFFSSSYIWPRNQTYTVSSALTVTGPEFKRNIMILFGTVCMGGISDFVWDSVHRRNIMILFGTVCIGGIFDYDRDRLSL